MRKIAPARAEAVLTRGRAYGESRLICNAHWQSDVAEGRLMGASTVARLHADAAFRDDLEAAHAELTTDVLLSAGALTSADERIADWQRSNEVALARAASFVTDITSGDAADLATLSVALREIRALVRAASLPSA